RAESAASRKPIVHDDQPSDAYHAAPTQREVVGKAQLAGECGQVPRRLLRKKLPDFVFADVKKLRRIIKQQGRDAYAKIRESAASRAAHAFCMVVSKPVKHVPDN